MKTKLLHLMLIGMLLSGVIISSASALGYGEEWTDHTTHSTQRYLDVPTSHWAYDNIERATNKNWFGGYPDGTFRPSASITRAEALKVYVVFLGLELERVTNSSYYDVNVYDWYSPYVEAGKDLFPKRTSIQGKVPFQPNMPITREDAIYALVKALGYESKVAFADQSILNMFSDKNSISNSIKSYMAVAVSEGLVAGYANGTIGGQDPLTRAEFATLLYRASFSGFNSQQEVKLHSVSINPSIKKELKVGETFTISATATYSDESKKEYENINPYNKDNNEVVSINGNRITGIKAGTCVVNFNDENLKDQSLVVIVSEIPEENEEEKNENIGSNNKVENEGSKDNSETDNNNNDNISEDVDEDSGDGNNLPDTNVSAANGENYNRNTALPIKVNNTIKDSILFSIEETNVAKLQERWYKITLPVAGKLSILYLSPDMSANVEVRSTDASKYIFGLFADDHEAKEESEYLLKGTYYIRVTKPKTSYGTYSLNVRFEETGDDNGWTEETSIQIEVNPEHKEYRLKTKYTDALQSDKYYDSFGDIYDHRYYKMTVPAGYLEILCKDNNGKTKKLCQGEYTGGLCKELKQNHTLPAKEKFLFHLDTNKTTTFIFDITHKYSSDLGIILDV